MTSDELRKQFFEWHEAVYGREADLSHGPDMAEWHAFEAGYGFAAAELDRLAARVAELERDADVREMTIEDQANALEAVGIGDASEDLWAEMKRQRDEAIARVAELERDSMSRTAIRHVLRAFYCDAKNSVGETAYDDDPDGHDFATHGMSCARSIAHRLGLDSDLE